MSDHLDSKMRELTYRLIAMAPDAPPFPEEPLVQLDSSPTPGGATPRRGYLLGMAAAAVAVLVLVGVPLLYLRGDSTPDTAIPAATQSPGFVPTTTTSPVSSTSEPEVTTTLAPASTARVCSGSDLDEELVDQPDLPPEVAATRRAIYDAATACDIPALAALAASGSYDFNASFGGDEPGPFWTEREGAGVPVLADLIRHLNLPFAAPQGEPGDLEVYVWPFASSLISLEEQEIPPADMAALLELYSIEELRQQFETIGGYVGWRTGITADGEWLFFVEGD